MEAYNECLISKTSDTHIDGKCVYILLIQYIYCVWLYNKLHFAQPSSRMYSIFTFYLP